MKDFTESDISIIKNMMLSSSHKDISFLLDCSREDIAGAINILIAGTEICTYQMKLDQKKAKRVKPVILKPSAPRKLSNAQKEKLEREKIREQKIKNKNHRLEIEQHRKNSRRQPEFKTKEIDYSKMRSIRIDGHTEIMIPAGSDAEAEKEKYLKNLNQKILNQLKK